MIDETQLPAGRVLSALTLLEVKGFVKRLPARYYELAKNNMEASMPNAKQNLVIVESPSKAKTIGNILAPTIRSRPAWAICAICRRAR